MRVSHLQIAPVKALAVVSRDEVTIGPHGVAEDRRLFLVTDDGSIATLRTIPRLVTVTPTLDLRARSLAVELPDGRRVEQPLTARGPVVRPRLHRRHRVGVVVPGPVADTLSEVAGVRLRLVVTDGRGQGWDEGPVTVLATESQRAVRGAAEGDAARFRMTVGVEGAAAFEEESWTTSRIHVGEAVLAHARPLGRCVVIERSPDSGERDWRGLRRLADCHPAGRVSLGIVASVLRAGRVRVGDRVEVQPVR
jgi:uncharacterized protein YcbX